MNAMRNSWWRLVAGTLLAAGTRASQSAPARLIVVDPGHFHATLLQREMYPGLDSRVSVYSRLGPELVDYLNRVSLFNARAADPTHWDLDIHSSARPLEEMLRAEAGRPGGMVVFSGRNRGKIDGILASINAGMHVLADKPWIIESADFAKLELALRRAAERHVAAYDIMTERYEVTAQVQRALVQASEVFGSAAPGDALHPGVAVRSVHQIMKSVAGVPLRRPAWFFDIEEYGEGLADVGTHPVDLVQWTLLPEQPFDYRQDVRMISARHEAVRIGRAQFAAVTGADDFPPALARRLRDGGLDYFCNNFIEYSLRGVRVKMDVLWNWDASGSASDLYEAAYQGTRARIELRQGAAERNRPEVYVVPAPAQREQVLAALDREIARLQSRWPGLAVVRSGGEARIEIPARFRIGHEEHFARVAEHFFQYVHDPASLPAWENSFMLAKYFVTTEGVRMARR